MKFVLKSGDGAVNQKIGQKVAAFITLCIISTALVPNAAIAKDRSSGGAVAPPRYVVRAVEFRAIDETNWDGNFLFPVSDEPYWVMSSVGEEGTARTKRSGVYGDVDSGETRRLGMCLWGRLFCLQGQEAPNGIGFSIQLWEHEFGDVNAIREKTRQAFEAAGPILTYTGAPAWIVKATPIIGRGLDYILSLLNDDLIGTRTYAYSASYLSNRLSVVGQSFTETRIYNGAETSGGGDYSLTIKVTRVA